MSGRPALRVLFIHGLEGGPKGSKAVYLAGLRESHNILTLTPHMRNTKNVFQSILIQLRAIRDFKPHVIVGSSYGGGLALLLLQTGAWRGPTILLAQALGMATKRALWLPEHHPEKIICVHGTKDTVIPLEHTKILVSSVKNDFVSYKEQVDTHGLHNTLVVQDILVKYVQECDTANKNYDLEINILAAFIFASVRLVYYIVRGGVERVLKVY
eukprot:Colp12_sorted_trinity150504_noHs@35474